MLNPWFAAVLSAPLLAAQQVAPSSAAPAPVPFETLAAQSKSAAAPFGLAGAAARASVEQEMRRLAEGGDGRALAWCLRHPGAGTPEQRAARSAGDVARLVREHAGAAWLRRPEHDPAAALSSADRATRSAVAAALAAEFHADAAARQLALFLEAAALAPSDERDAALAPAALARLDELRAGWPAGPWAARAADLAWRIEHLAPGLTAPDLVLCDVDGNELVLEDWRGGAVLVDVWRSDDSDRAQRAAELARLLQRVRGQRPELGLRVLALGLGDDALAFRRVLALGLGDDALAFRRELEELELPWPTAFEPESGGPARAAWRLDGRPTTLWIDAAGVVRARGGSLTELEALLLAPAPAERAPEAGSPRPAADVGTSDASGPGPRGEA